MLVVLERLHKLLALLCTKRIADNGDELHASTGTSLHDANLDTTLQGCQAKPQDNYPSNKTDQ